MQLGWLLFLPAYLAPMDTKLGIDIHANPHIYTSSCPKGHAEKPELGGGGPLKITEP